MPLISFARRALRAYRRHGLLAMLGGVWLARHFDTRAPVYWSGGWPLPSISNRGRLETESCALYSGVRLEVGEHGRLTIGKGTYLERSTRVICHERVAIGRNCQISWDVVIMDSDQHERQGISRSIAPVMIGDNVWIGCRAIVLKGVTIGEGAVIGAGAVVTHDIPPYAVAVGQPARVIRDLRAVAVPR